jgi:hypothetical protein
MRWWFLILLIVGVALPTAAAPTKKKPKLPAKPSLAVLPIAGVVPADELRSLEDELRRLLPGFGYVVQPREKTRATLSDMVTLGVGCDTGEVDCLVQVGGLAGVNLTVRGGVLVDGADALTLELLAVDVQSLKERARAKVKISRSDKAARQLGLESALTGVLLPELWRGALRVVVANRGASIVVDGVLSGIAPKSDPIVLTPGAHELFVGLEGFASHRQTVDIAFNDERTVEVVLVSGVSEPLPRYGTKREPNVTATSTTRAAAAGEEAPASARKAPLRVVLYDVEAVGVEPRIARVMGQLLTEEIRKREHVSVLDSSELRAIVGAGESTTGDVRGCSVDECFAEVAEALGADAVVVSQLTQSEGQILFGLRRVNIARQEVASSFLERVPLDETAALLPFVGTSIAGAFPDLSLRKGQQAGVDDRAQRRLQPPPLSPVYATSLGVGAVVAATTTAVSAGALVWFGQEYGNLLQAAAGDGDDENAALQTAARGYDNARIATAIAGGAGAVLVVAALVTSAYTDWENDGAEAKTR